MKGDLSDPTNWRPIMLFDVLQKIMSSLAATAARSANNFPEIPEIQPADHARRRVLD